jgi:hypothetical protein
MMMRMRVHAAAASASSGAATWKLAMVSLLLLKASSFPNQTPRAQKLKRRKAREAKLISANETKRDAAWYIQAEKKDFAKEPRNISSPFRRPPSRPAAALLFSWRSFRYGGQQGGDETEKQKKRKRFGGRKILPAAAAGAGAGAGSNWVDQDRQEPKKRPWHRIDFF